MSQKKEKLQTGVDKFYLRIVFAVSPNEQHTRRSKRTIVPPLQYWKNERIDYERRKSGTVNLIENLFLNKF